MCADQTMDKDLVVQKTGEEPESGDEDLDEGNGQGGERKHQAQGLKRTMHDEDGDHQEQDIGDGQGVLEEHGVERQRSSQTWEEGSRCMARATNFICTTAALTRDPRKILMQGDELPDVREAVKKGVPKGFSMEGLKVPNDGLLPAQMDTLLSLVVEAMPTSEQVNEGKVTQDMADAYGLKLKKFFETWLNKTSVQLYAFCVGLDHNLSKTATIDMMGVPLLVRPVEVATLRHWLHRVRCVEEGKEDPGQFLRPTSRKAGHLRSGQEDSRDDRPNLATESEDTAAKTRKAQQEEREKEMAEMQRELRERWRRQDDERGGGRGSPSSEGDRSPGRRSPDKKRAKSTPPRLRGSGSQTTRSPGKGKSGSDCGSRQQIVGFTEDQMERLLSRVQSGQKSSSGSGAITSTAIAKTGLSKLTQSARENIDAREPFNVASLCADNIRRLTNFSSRRGQGHLVRGDDNSVIWDKEESVDAPREMSLDPTCVRSGLEKYVQLHGESKIQEIKSRTS